MKKKILLLTALVFASVFMLTGCTLKKISADDFKKQAEDYGLTVSDSTSAYKYLGYIDKLYIAKHSDGWRVEFYELTDEEHATTIYNTNKAKFESAAGSTSASSTLTTQDGERFSVTTGGYYKHVCRIGNTFVYANIKTEYKDEAVKFLKKIGY